MIEKPFKIECPNCGKDNCGWATKATPVQISSFASSHLSANIFTAFCCEDCGYYHTVDQRHNLDDAMHNYGFDEEEKD